MTEESGHDQAAGVGATWRAAVDRVAEAGPAGWLSADLACPDCPAEVRVTEGKAVLRARVIHLATCPWWRRYQAREVVGRIPCGTVVTHRGPYKRDPDVADRGPA